MPPSGAGPVDRRRALGAGALGISAVVLPTASAAASVVTPGTAAPEGTTSVDWSDGDPFDAWSARTTTTTDLTPTQAICWQPFQAHVDLHLAAGTAEALGIATYTGGSNTWYWHVAVSTVADTLGSFGAVVDVGSQARTLSSPYVAGGFYATAPTTSVDVPAGRYFLVGVRRGPFYRSFRDLEAPRTATSGGAPQFSVVDRVYHGPHAAGSSSKDVPSQLGGAGDFFSEEVGTVAVISIRLRQGLSG